MSNKRIQDRKINLLIGGHLGKTATGVSNAAATFSWTVLFGSCFGLFSSLECPLRDGFPSLTLSLILEGEKRVFSYLNFDSINQYKMDEHGRG